VSEQNIGKPVDRIDAKKKVTGTATYAAEVAVSNVAYGVIATSVPASGALVSVDIKAARRAPGVLAVLTPDTAPKLPTANKKNTDNDRILQLFQDRDIHYSDHPIALVIADTLERAQYAAGLVNATYLGGTSAAHDMAQMIPTAYTPKSAGPAGDTDTRRGDVDAGLAAADVRVDQLYTTPVENHHPMEMHATIAVWQGDDHLTLYDATQGIFGVRQRIATVFGIPKENVRVINHYVGGGFGSKGSPWSHVALAAFGAKQIGRPVKLMVTRPQMFSLTGHRPKTIQHIQLGADKTGRLTAIRHDSASETSRFDTFVEPSALQTRHLYSCPNVVTSHKLVKLDIPTPTFQRAPGEATGTFALESAMDELAYALNIDPLELRIKNHAIRDEQENKPFSSKSLLACYTAAAKQFGWSKRKHAPRSLRAGTDLVGWGMATATYPARQQPASAIAKIKYDGSALVQAGTQDIGTGTYTIMTQIASDALTMPYEKVTFDLGDTAYPETPVSGGSFTASSTGSAVKLACRAAITKLAQLASADPASPLHGTAPEVIQADNGALVIKDAPGKRDPFIDVLKRAKLTEIVAEIKTKPSDDHKTMSMHSFGAVFAEVHVDEELGRVRVARMVAAYAAGKILNPKTARSQFIGGLVWGLGMATHEETVRDPRTARVVTRGLDDYHVPVNADIPDLEVIMIDEVDEHVNEIGAKGIGEIGITGAAAAIANAVFHATGVRIRDLPIRLDKLLPEGRA
jgi:xanthine dehydrogenase YagR molybdenum-binding subunit